jgi:PAS domain S-box-containing protein
MEAELSALTEAFGRALRAVGARVIDERGAEPRVEVGPRPVAELLRSEERFRELVEAIPEPVFIVGLRGLSYANPAAVRLFGYDNLEEALGKDPRSVAHPDDVPQLEQRARAMFVERRVLPPFEYRVRRKDGELLTLEVSSIPVDYEGVPSILTFARDATRRKRQEAALLQEDRLAVLGLLAGGLAHAMNNPLSYVLMDLEQAARALAKGPTTEAEREEILHCLREAHQGAQRIGEVVRRMRSLSRIDDEGRAPVDVKKVLEAALELMGNELRHRGAVVTELREVPAVMASAGRLEQVFLNLLAHAAQSLPETGHGRVEISLRAEQDLVVVDVLDVQPDVRIDPHRVLEPFHTPHEGLRLNLSLPLCRSVVEGLGGELAVDDTERGMRVRVVLPSVERVHGGSLPPPSRAEPRVRVAARILAIDADSGVAASLRLLLDPGESLACVRDAREAIDDLLADSAFDLVLCDAAVAPEVLDALVERRPALLDRVVLTAADPSVESVRALASRVGGRTLEKPLRAEALRALRESVRAQ